MCRVYSAPYLVGVLALILTGAQATRAAGPRICCPPIILPDGFDNIGEMNPGGTLLRLSLLTEEAYPEGQQESDLIRLRVIVTQEETGAVGVGEVIITQWIKEAPEALIHRVPGSAPFEPGVVEVNGWVDYVRKSQVLQTWTWTQPVLILP